MSDRLFERPHALARQLSAPLVEERRQYLSLCHAQEFSRSSLRLTAQLLVATAEYLKLDDRLSAIITLQEVEEAGSRWSQRVSLLPIENPRLSRQRFVHSATGWLAFLGRLEIPSTPGKPYDPLVVDFAEFLRNERGLSTATIELRSFTVRAFLDRLGMGERSLDTISVADVDSALAQSHPAQRESGGTGERGELEPGLWRSAPSAQATSFQHSAVSFRGLLPGRLRSSCSPRGESGPLIANLKIFGTTQRF